MFKAILTFFLSFIIFIFLFKLLVKIIGILKKGASTERNKRSQYSHSDNYDNQKTPKKHFSKNEGEYVDYIEIKDDEDK